MKFDFVTPFPEMVTSYMGQSLMKRAVENHLIIYDVLNPREWSTDRHQSIDDKVFGGGEGMVGKVEPFFNGLQAYRNKHQQETIRIIHLSPQGGVLTTEKIKQLSRFERLCFVCSRYSGLDQRILNTSIDEEISLGDYVVAGGELPALIVTEAVCRFIPGFLGDAGSAAMDSFAIQGLEGPLFTQPRRFQDWEVPEVYLQGNHKKIEAYRRITGLLNTLMKRPELDYPWSFQDLHDAHNFLKSAPDSELEVLGYLKQKIEIMQRIVRLVRQMNKAEDGDSF
ncbi:MAG: tRNA (guanosine(37)-N1)-methyltransferase TrmD [Pseudobdellovibrionaceae bacterium]